MKITLPGAHNAETKDTRHTCLLIDDLIAVDAGSLTANMTLEEQCNLKAVLLSHRHYDHIRDIVALGANLYHAGKSIGVYASDEVIQILNDHFFYSRIYRNLVTTPEENPAIRLNRIEPLQTFHLAGYTITPVPVKHSAETLGFRIISADDKEVFYTSDTGPGLKECWQQIAPQVLIIEVSDTNASTETFRQAGHLTPNLLKEELVSFQDEHDYIPAVFTVHMNPVNEDDIIRELELVAEELDCSIILGREGMEIVI